MLMAGAPDTAKYEFKINYMKAATGTIMAPTAARG
jgi:hypothetical protein